MNAEEETPAQRQARIRQQKREAKLRSSGQERLDKITRLSGRAPESMSTSSPLQPSTPQTASSTSEIGPQASLPAGNWMGAQANTPEQQRLQEEYMRVLLGGSQPGQEGQTQTSGQQGEGEEDPMIKMMQSMLGGMSGDPNAPPTGGLPFSADEISKMTGIPSFLTSMFLGGKQQQAPLSANEVTQARVWKMIRIVLSVLIGLYTVITLDSSIATFGRNPPAPATIRNPFVIFLTGQLLINGTRIAFSEPGGQGGIMSYFRTIKATAADGAILIFILGVYSWWNGYA